MEKEDKLQIQKRDSITVKPHAEWEKMAEVLKNPAQHLIFPHNISFIFIL